MPKPIRDKVRICSFSDLTHACQAEQPALSSCANCCQPLLHRAPASRYHDVVQPSVFISMLCEHARQRRFARQRRLQAVSHAQTLVLRCRFCARLPCGCSTYRRSAMHESPSPSGVHIHAGAHARVRHLARLQRVWAVGHARVLGGLVCLRRVQRPPQPQQTCLVCRLLMPCTQNLQGPTAWPSSMHCSPWHQVGRVALWQTCVHSRSQPASHY